jgi:D-3-phosphoglycerate dehydrogenase
MSLPKVAMLGTRYPDLDIEESGFGGVAEIVVGDGDSAESILEVASDAAVILAGNPPVFSPDVISQLSCQAIIRSGIGVDTVDLSAAKDAGMWVVNIPDYGTDAVAFHALTLGVAGMRRLVAADAVVRRGEWGFLDLRPMRLPSSCTLGVVGFGRIGRRVTELFQGVGFGSVIAHDPFMTPEGQGVTAGSLDDVLSGADVVTLHAPPPDDGSALIGARELALMRPGSTLVNTARGALIDSAALAASLAEGRPALAALDVFSSEPPDLSVFEAVLDKMIMSPHTAWYTEESQDDLRRKSVDEARRVLAGERPKSVIVDPNA